MSSTKTSRRTRRAVTSVTAAATPARAEPTHDARNASILEGLNEPQRAAVLHEGGPLLIIAGAGTGKTAVITRRVAHLIASKRARPEEILALTFTEKAAQEMEERVDVLVPYGYTDIWISTFHAFGDRVLREQALAIGLSADARILSGPEQIAFLRQRLFQLPLRQFRPAHDPTRYLHSLITLFSRAKDEEVTPEEYQAYAERLQMAAAAHPDDRAFAERATLQLELARTYATYQELLHADDHVDFGDQILLTLQLLRQHPEILRQYRERFRYVLVDEFQDTNYAQFQLVRTLCPNPDDHLTIVADDDQSIYKFRGAAISNILQFVEAYPRARQVVLTHNFRSTQPILDCAYRLIQQNNPDRLEVKRHIDKRLIAQRTVPHATAPEHHRFDTASSEADWVARTIVAHVEQGAWCYRDCAILVRSNRDADIFLRAMNVAGIPWWFTGTTGLYAREEIRLCLAFLHAIGDPLDGQSLYVLAASDIYRTPMADLTACLSVARHHNRPFIQVLRQPSRFADVPPLSEDAQRCVKRLLDDLDRYTDASRTQSPGQLLYRFLSERGYLKRLAQAETANDVEQLQNIALLFERIQRFEHVAHGDRLPGLLQQLDVLREAGENPAVAEADPNVDAVNVLTIHKAKGLEFPVVFLVGLVQGRFPVRAQRDPLELPDALIKDILPSGDFHLQEERRLFYVGMTRARDRLYLTSAEDYGGKSVRKVSQFLLEALNLPKPTTALQRTAALELIQRSSPPTTAVAGQARWTPPPLSLRLDPHGIDDYLTCPLKYKFSHVLRIPVMRHHVVVYGSALHKAIEVYLKRKQQTQRATLEALWQAFEEAWSSEGFLTREHEELRLAQGRAVLADFHQREESSPIVPTYVEERFSFKFGRYTVNGRWDRVDVRGPEVVIVDYKSSDVRVQEEADRRARQSTQLGLYAMSWQQLHGRLPDRVELHFLESRLIGSAVPDADTQTALAEQMDAVIEGLEANDFHAEPQEHNCRWCAYQGICPSAYGQR